MMSTNFFVGSLLFLGIFLLTAGFTVNRLMNGQNGFLLIMCVIIAMVTLSMAYLFYICGVDKKKREKENKEK